MSTLTPLRRTTHVPPRFARRNETTPREAPRLAWRIFHAVQTVWLATMVVLAIVSGPFIGAFVLWLVGAAVIATLGFGYREIVLYDYPSRSL